MAKGLPPSGQTTLQVRPQRRRWLERLLAAAVETTPAPVLVTEADSPGESIIFANRAFLDLTGFPLDEVCGRSLAFLYGAETNAAAVATIDKTIESNGDGTVDVLLYRKDGARFESSLFIHPIADPADGKANLRHHFLSFGDSSDPNQAEKRTRALALRVHQQAAVAALGQRALAGADLGALFDEAVACVAAGLNVRLVKLLELMPGGDALLVRAGLGWHDDVVGSLQLSADVDTSFGYTLRTGAPLVSADLALESRFRASALLRDHGVRSLIAVVVRGRGRPFGVLEADSTERRAFVPADVSFLQAIANVLAAAIERRTAEEHVRHLSLHDPLTGLPNRALFRDRLDLAFAQAQRSGATLAVLLLDLDDFKGVNDTLGHPVGDRLLIEAAKRLQVCVREADTLARLGGDEFALVLTDLHRPDGAATVAQKVIDEMAEPFRIGTHELHVGVSVGITVHPHDGHDSQRLLKNADLALYQAKLEGGSAYRFFAAEMATRVEARKSLERQLRRALELNGLGLRYQPQLDLTAGRVTGAEVLVRWRHPQRGLLPPAEFIPVAEVSGLIVPLGRWVLKETCVQARIWRDASLPPIVVAVNVSLAQLRAIDIVAVVEEALRGAGLEPSSLELEITEGVFLNPEHDARIVEDLRRLRASGVHIALDDFGTGYSNLGWLRRLPVDRLKIDRSFVAGLGRDTDDIVRAMIQLGHSFGLRVTAEGVETAAQLDFLRACGCDTAQGFHVSRPLPAAGFAALLRSQA